MWSKKRRRMMRHEQEIKAMKLGIGGRDPTSKLIVGSGSISTTTSSSTTSQWSSTSSMLPKPVPTTLSSLSGHSVLPSQHTQSHLQPPRLHHNQAPPKSAYQSLAPPRQSYDSQSRREAPFYVSKKCVSNNVGFFMIFIFEYAMYIIIFLKI